MSSKDLKAASSFGEADYNELLRQAVAVLPLLLRFLDRMRNMQM